ncbi:MAG: magnesium transporter [Nitrospinae bacterium]|nr:magnesium transporter [Nitrospinota bacterium]
MLNEGLVSQIAEELRGGRDGASLVEAYHTADIASALERLESDEARIAAFDAIPEEEAAEILAYLDDHYRSMILERSSAGKIGRIITHLDSDDAADILASVDDDIAEKVLRSVSDEAPEVVALLQYDEESAGGIMQTELMSAPGHFTVRQTIDAMAGKEEEIGDIHNVFVTDAQQRLVGVVPLRKLILAAQDKKMRDLVGEGPLVYATTEMDQEKVAQLFKRYDLVSLPVVDGDGRLTGRILIDDVVDVLEDEASEDIMKLVGANEEALDAGRSALQMARYRLPWLASSLVAGFITGGVILQFEGALKELVALTAFIPIIMGVSGNVSTQSSTLVIRGLATGKFNPEALTSYFVREVKIGVTLGAVCGVASALFALIWQGSPMLGVVVGVSLFLAIMCAAILGTIIPLFFRWVNIDPAIAGGPMVLALNDLTGVLIFFGIATSLISYLI